MRLPLLDEIEFVLDLDLSSATLGWGDGIGEVEKFIASVAA